MADRGLSVRNNNTIKLIALLSIVRWYNILLTAVAQYLSAFVLLGSSRAGLYIMLFDYNLHAIVIASVFSIAAGFIINNFYDFEKDLINRPGTTLFNRIVSKQTTLNCYMLFNITALIIAFSASIYIGIFFMVFIFSLWIYSHKVQKMPFIKEFVASVLTIACFFAVLLHYSTFTAFIFIYGAFFMTLVYGRELVKQFINYNGDLALNIQSLPVWLGLDKARYFLGFIMVLSFLGGLSILIYDGLEQRNYFILLAIVIVMVSLGLLQKVRYKTINLIYKVLIVMGILNILWV